MKLHGFSKLVRYCSDERTFIRKEIIPHKKNLGRRILTHLTFAHCEAIASFLKEGISADFEKNDHVGPIDPEHWLASMNEEYVIDDEGGVRERERRTKALSHLLFSLRYAAKYLSKEFDLKKVEGWQHVKPAYGVRNRITHPSVPSNLLISDTDIQHIEGLELWLTACIKIVT